MGIAEHWLKAGRGSWLERILGYFVSVRNMSPEEKTLRIAIFGCSELTRRLRMSRFLSHAHASLRARARRSILVLYAGVPA